MREAGKARSQLLGDKSGGGIPERKGVGKEALVMEGLSAPKRTLTFTQSEMES